MVFGKICTHETGLTEGRVSAGKDSHLRPDRRLQLHLAILTAIVVSLLSPPGLSTFCQPIERMQFDSAL